MSAEPLCFRTFGETIRPCMSKKMCKKEYLADKNVFESDDAIRSRTSIDGTLIHACYNLLLESILYLPIANEEKDIPDISRPMITQIKRGKAEVHNKIKEIAQRKNADVSVGVFFAVNITPNIPKVLDTVLDSIDALVQNDASLGKKMQTTLKKSRTNKTPADYLAEVLVVAICSGTNIVSAHESAQGGISPEMSALEEAEALLATIPAPPNITPPESIAKYELKYITELFSAYGDAESIADFDESSLVAHPDYVEDLHDRRIDYFAAESVRRGVSELHGDLYQGQFDTLKNETHDGVKDTARRTHPNGYERMLAVMEQAVKAPVHGYVLSSSHNWINNKIKKGICHFLVIDGKLKWVK